VRCGLIGTGPTGEFGLLDKGPGYSLEPVREPISVVSESMLALTFCPEGETGNEDRESASLGHGVIGRLAGNSNASRGCARALSSRAWMSSTVELSKLMQERRSAVGGSRHEPANCGHRQSQCAGVGHYAGSIFLDRALIKGPLYSLPKLQ
jgi:hypothetical protein